MIDLDKRDRVTNRMDQGSCLQGGIFILVVLIIVIGIVMAIIKLL